MATTTNNNNNSGGGEEEKNKELTSTTEPTDTRSDDDIHNEKPNHDDDDDDDINQESSARFKDNDEDKDKDAGVVVAAEDLKAAVVAASSSSSEGLPLDQEEEEEQDEDDDDEDKVAVVVDHGLSIAAAAASSSSPSSEEIPEVKQNEEEEDVDFPPKSDIKCPNGHDLHVFAVYQDININESNNNLSCTLCNERKLYQRIGSSYRCSTLDINICDRCVPLSECRWDCDLCKNQLAESSFHDCPQCEFVICDACVQQNEDSIQEEIDRIKTTPSFWLEVPYFKNHHRHYVENRDIILYNYWFLRGYLEKEQADSISIASKDIQYSYWYGRVGNKDLVDMYDRNTWPGLRLKDAPEWVRNDKTIVTRAVYCSFGFAFEFASPSLQQDKEFVLQVLQQQDEWSGWALQFVSPELQQDKQVVIAAVKNSFGWAFECASPSLRQDKDFVLQVVSQGGYALPFVSPELQKDKQVVLAAVNNEPDAISYAPDDLKRDRDILIASGMFDSQHQDVTLRRTNTTKIVLSTRFALTDVNYSQATTFTARFKGSGYFKDEGNNFVVYCPNAFDKKTCDPNWTDFDWPCRGTKDICKGWLDDDDSSNAGQYKTNILTDDGRPTNKCCWRYSFRNQLEEAKDTGGFMIQLIETEPTVRVRKKVKDATLGNGQKIELDMATTIGLKVFHVYRPEEENNGSERGFSDRHIDFITSQIKDWYDNGCQDTDTVTEIRQKS